MTKLLVENAQLITLLFSLVVTISTLVYAILTAVLVTETRKMRQVQTEPKIEVLIQPRKEWINLAHLFVRNIGQGPAYDVSLKLIYDSSDEGARRIAEDFLETNFMKTGIKYLGPGQEYRTACTSFLESFEKKINANITVDATYKSQVGKITNEQFRFNMNEFKGMQQEAHYIHDISENLKRIMNVLEKITSTFNRLRVDIYSNRDRKEELARFHEHAKQAADEKKRQT